MSAAIRFMSSSGSWKSDTSRFCSMRSLWADIGRTTMPRRISRRRASCATLLLYLPPIQVFAYSCILTLPIDNAMFGSISS